MSISRRSGDVVLRSELAGLGGRSQLSEALKSLMKDGKLLRLGSGVYAKARKDARGQVHLVGKPEQIAEEVFKKLGLKVNLVRVETSGDRDLYLMDPSDHRVARKLQIGGGHIQYVRPKGQGVAKDLMQMPQDIEMLPKSGVGAFVDRFARAHKVVYERSRLDDWAEAVTRAAGDDVRLDRTEKVLVALKKLNLVSGRQAARLLTNYMREAEDVRSVPGLRDGRLSP
jgi:hypothetical protein